MKSDLDLQSFIGCGSLIRLDENQYLIGWGKRIWMEDTNKTDQPCFYFPDFFLSGVSPWFRHECTKLIEKNHLLSSIPDSGSLTSLFWSNPFFNLFEKAFYEIKFLIEQGDLKKAVPYIFEISQATISKERLLLMIKHLLGYTNAQPLHVYGFWDENNGILGASPEILFKYDHENIIETCACAGTISHIQENYFADNPKEILEHEIVVEGISSALSPFGLVKIGKRQKIDFPKLSHLITPIKIKVNEKINFSTFVNALHPTPALGAFPKEQGMSWLRSYHQKIPRGRYGAPIGCTLEGGQKGKCIVGIRNIQWNIQGTKMGAGCGIVKESLLEKEWKEICLKISSIKAMLSL